MADPSAAADAGLRRALVRADRRRLARACPRPPSPASGPPRGDSWSSSTWRWTTRPRTSSPWPIAWPRATAEMVVASRPGRWAGPLALRLLGTTDPTSGLVGLTRAAADRGRRLVRPGGLAVRPGAAGPGRRAGGSTCRSAGSRPARDARRSLGDLRQAQAAGRRPVRQRLPAAPVLLRRRLGDGRQPDLLRPPPVRSSARTVAGRDGGPAGRAGRSPWPWPAVLAIAIALTWNFSLNRRLTFNDARRGSIGRQYLRYVLSNLLGIGVSLTLSLVLPNQSASSGATGWRRPWWGSWRRPGSASRWPAGSSSARSRPPKAAVAPIRRRRCDGLRLHAPGPARAAPLGGILADPGPSRPLGRFGSGRRPPRVEDQPTIVPDFLAKTAHRGGPAS